MDKFASNFVESSQVWATMKISKLILFAAPIAGVIAIASPALAADMSPAPRAYTKAPPSMPAVSDWGGFYVGGDVGWAGSRQNGEVDALPSPGFGSPALPGNGTAGFGVLPTNYGLKRDGVIGGLYAGYNWQFGHAVLGIEGDFSYLGGSGSSTQSLFSTFTGAPTLDGSKIQLTAKERWLASVRGRLGYASDRIMVYATGGVAFTEERSNLNLIVPPVQIGGLFDLNDAPSGSTSFSQNRTGYVVGAGLEWMFAPKWIGRIEYLHYGFNGITGSLPLVSNECTVAVNCRFQGKLSDLNVDSIRIGVGYKFGDPVVAKY
jgi:outer membrane immunogenic protein